MNFQVLSCLAATPTSTTREKHPFLGLALKAGGAVLFGFAGAKAGEWISNNTINKPTNSGAPLRGDPNFFAPAQQADANGGRDVFDLLSRLFSVMGNRGGSSRSNVVEA